MEGYNSLKQKGATSLKNELDFRWGEEMVKGLSTYIPHTRIGDVIKYQKIAS